MKNAFLYLIVILSSTILKAQPYTNTIVPTEFANVNAFNIYKMGHNYIVSGIYFDNKSTIINLDQTLSSFQYYHFDSTSFSYRPFTLFGNNIYVFSKNRFFEKGLEFFALNANFEINKLYDITTSGNRNFPTSSIFISQNILSSYTYNENNVNKMGVFCARPDGSILWNNVYENNIKNSIIWRLSPSKSNDLLASYAILYKNEFESVARVMKIDTLGNELWKSDTLPGIFDINSPVSIAQLSDSSIFVTFTKDMRKDSEYILNWHPLPPTYIWLDKDGHVKKEHILKIDRDYEVDISEVKAGKGDYFYVYGALRSVEDENYYGIITKYDNHGDTIWTHRYRHPDYDISLCSYYIKDLVEEDNGDLTVLGAITPVGRKPEVWVFRVNSEGCYGTDSCDEVVLSAAVSHGTGHGIVIYPNPTTGRVTLEGLTMPGIYTIRIYSIGGRLMRSYVTRDPSEIDLGRFDSGVYLINVTGERINTTIKVVRQ